ncbi:membrane bound O-acyl transferase, partial [Dichotomocladium elegans]
KGLEGDTQLDYSGAMMIVTIKLTSFGFNVADGRGGAVTDYDKRMQIKQYPSLMEFFGWVFFFSGFMTGPTCEYMDYIRFTHHFFLSADSKVSPVRPTLHVLSKVAAVMLFLVFVAPTFAMTKTLEPSFTALPIYQRLLFIMVSAIGTRSKYYCIWLLYEGSFVLCGFGYNGYDPRTGRHRWNRISNVDIVEVELSQSYKQLSSKWNIGANNWLRHYVYVRLVPPNTKPKAIATIMTYLASGLWHGFHPGYYFLFISVALLQVLGRRVRRAVHPFMFTPDGQTPLPRKKVYDFLGWLFTMGTVAFLVTPFDLLYISRTFYVWRQVYYPHYCVLVLGWCFVLAAEKRLLAMQKRYCVKPAKMDNVPPAVAMLN